MKSMFVHPQLSSPRKHDEMMCDELEWHWIERIALPRPNKLPEFNQAAPNCAQS